MDKIDDAESIEVYSELEHVRNTPLIQNKGFLGITGYTKDGQYVAFPDSFERGFKAELTPLSERPKVNFEIGGIATVTTDGHLNYTPSYNMGREIGREYKMMVIAERTKRLADENSFLRKTVNDLKNKLDDFIRGSE